MRLSLVLILVLGLVLDLCAQDDYQPGPDSIAQPNIPKGELIKGTYTAKEGSVFPGTERDYTIYLPAGFDKAKSAPFIVFQDGVIYNAPVVFDNLIAKKQIPPLIGLFIKPGVVPAANPNALPRDNRSYEYDSVTNTYARFLIDEFLPTIEAKHGIKLSTDPNDAAIAGTSSGGICAFMAAWHRPDRIRRVFSAVGTYVGIRGGDQLPVLVRKCEPKPLRVYLQSGEHDNNLYCGDWWMANQMMERSLTWAGYDVNHAWGTGGHSANHATAIFPDVMRWLWRDYATTKEIKSNPRSESKWVGYKVLGDGGWEVESDFKHRDSVTAFQMSADGKVTKARQPSERTLLYGGKRLGELPKVGRVSFDVASTTLSPDQTMLYATRPFDAYVHCFQVIPDGSLRLQQPYYQLQALDDGTVGGVIEAGGMCVDTNGWLYVATALGIQVCDTAGRVNFIIPTPQQPHDVCFGGKDLGELFIACGDKIYKRPTKAHGYVSGQMAPIKPVPRKL